MSRSFWCTSIARTKRCLYIADFIKNKNEKRYLINCTGLVELVKCLTVAAGGSGWLVMLTERSSLTLLPFLT